MTLALIGLSHRTAPVAVREKVTFPAHVQPDALAKLTAYEEVTEAVIVSTCNRTELYVAVKTGTDGIGAVTSFLSSYHDIPVDELRPYLYTVEGDGAIEHLFRVISSLDSMILGEAQILGQIRMAYGFALENGATGNLFNKLFRQALEVGKRVRTETEIGANSVSISTAAVNLAKRVFETLSGRTVLIIGAGEMSELTARYLVDSGAKSVLVANRTYERACDIAVRFSGEAIRFDDLFKRMAEADIVISSTAAPGYVITREEVARARHSRRGSSCLLIDIALPRDIDPACNELDDVYVYDIDDLNGIVDMHREERRQEAELAEKIVADEVDTFKLWCQTLEVKPTIKQMRLKAERIRDAEVERAIKHLGSVNESEREVIEAMANSIITKMLHGPIARLRKHAGESEAYRYTEAARFLYGLDTNPEGRTPPECLAAQSGKCRIESAGSCAAEGSSHCKRSTANSSLTNVSQMNDSDPVDGVFSPKESCNAQLR